MRINIVGEFDEHSKLPIDIECESLVVDFEGMTIINSAGIRTWLNWTQQIKNVSKIYLENCRFKFVDQARYVKGIFPKNFEVLSFYIPFYNPKTDKTFEIKVLSGVDFSNGKINIPKPLDESGEPLELDVDQKYFSFLN